MEKGGNFTRREKQTRKENENANVHESGKAHLKVFQSLQMYLKLTEAARELLKWMLK